MNTDLVGRRARPSKNKDTDFYYEIVAVWTEYSISYKPQGLQLMCALVEVKGGGTNVLPFIELDVEAWTSP